MFSLRVFDGTNRLTVDVTTYAEFECECNSETAWSPLYLHRPLQRGLPNGYYLMSCEDLIDSSYRRF